MNGRGPGQTPGSSSYSLGRVFGVELRVHWSLILVLVILLLGSLMASGVAGAVGTMLIVLSLAVSVTLHELGHIGAAHLFGNGTSGITLYPFGGIARLARESRTPKEEMLVALAGPAVNVVLAGLAAIPLAIFGAIEPLWTFMLINVVLAAFNLVPAYPMDGGRVLRGALWKPLGHFDATWYAARAGQVFAFLFGVLGMFYSGMLVVIAVFVFMQATAELARLKIARWAGINLDPGAQHDGWANPWSAFQQQPSPDEPRWVEPPTREPRATYHRGAPFTRVRWVVRDGREVPEDASPWR